MSIIGPFHKVVGLSIKHSMFALKQAINFSEIKFKLQTLLEMHIEAVVQGCSVKKVFLKISQNSHTCARVAFLINCRPGACNFIKTETPAQVFSYEFCEILKNTFSIENLRWLLLYIPFDTIGFVVLGFTVLVLHCPHNTGHLPRAYELLQLLSISLLQ